MRLIRHYRDIPGPAQGTVIAIGNFDGVHLGHQMVIAKAAALARAEKAPLGILTFEPHPRQYFNPDGKNFRLTPFRMKMRCLEALGVDYVFNLRFDKSLVEKSAEAFVADVLVAGLKIRHAVVGRDFHFGKGRRGNVALLEGLGKDQGFGVLALEPLVEVHQPGAGPYGAHTLVVLDPPRPEDAAKSLIARAEEKYGDVAVCSSSVIRERIRTQDIKGSMRLLGRPWEIEGRVLKGDRRGRQIGFPTANIDPGGYSFPGYGVFAIKAAIDRGGKGQEALIWHDGVANYGKRPTVDGETLRLEVHLFDFAGDLYGKHLRVAFLDFLRAERRFESLEALKTQIFADCAEARAARVAYSGPKPGEIKRLIG